MHKKYKKARIPPLRNQNFLSAIIIVNRTLNIQIIFFKIEKQIIIILKPHVN